MHHCNKQCFEICKIHTTPYQFNFLNQILKCDHLSIIDSLSAAEDTDRRHLSLCISMSSFQFLGPLPSHSRPPAKCQYTCICMIFTLKTIENALVELLDYYIPVTQKQEL